MQFPGSTPYYPSAQPTYGAPASGTYRAQAPAWTNPGQGSSVSPQGSSSQVTSARPAGFTPPALSLDAIKSSPFSQRVAPSASAPTSTLPVPSRPVSSRGASPLPLVAPTIPGAASDSLGGLMNGLSPQEQQQLAALMGMGMGGPGGGAAAPTGGLTRGNPMFPAMTPQAPLPFQQPAALGLPGMSRSGAEPPTEQRNSSGFLFKAFLASLTGLAAVLGGKWLWDKYQDNKSSKASTDPAVSDPEAAKAAQEKYQEVKDKWNALSTEEQGNLSHAEGRDLMVQHLQAWRNATDMTDATAAQPVQEQITWLCDAFYLSPTTLAPLPSEFPYTYARALDQLTGGRPDGTHDGAFVDNLQGNLRHQAMTRPHQSKVLITFDPSTNRHEDLDKVLEIYANALVNHGDVDGSSIITRWDATPPDLASADNQPVAYKNHLQSFLAETLHKESFHKQVVVMDIPEDYPQPLLVDLLQRLNEMVTNNNNRLRTDDSNTFIEAKRHTYVIRLGGTQAGFESRAASENTIHKPYDSLKQLGMVE